MSVCLEASDICHSRDDSQFKTEKNLDFFGFCPKLWCIGVKLRMNVFVFIEYFVGIQKDLGSFSIV